MESDELSPLKQKQQHYTEWLRRYGTAKEIVPQVQANLEMTNWEIDALTNRPTVAGEIPPDTLHVLEDDYRYAISAFPLMPAYDPLIAGASTSITASGTASVYDYVARSADYGFPETTAYSTKYTVSYRELQDHHRRPDQVRKLMEIFCTANTLGRFDKSRRAYDSTQSGAVPRTDAALAIRNTLDGIKGDLFQRARKNAGENMTWEKMAESLAKGEFHGEEYSQLIRQESVRSKLTEGLSDILKDRNPGSGTDLDNLWTQALDFIFAVLGLLAPTVK